MDIHVPAILGYEATLWLINSFQACGVACGAVYVWCHFYYFGNACRSIYFFVFIMMFGLVSHDRLILLDRLAIDSPGNILWLLYNRKKFIPWYMNILVYFIFDWFLMAATSSCQFHRHSYRYYHSVGSIQLYLSNLKTQTCFRLLVTTKSICNLLDIFLPQTNTMKHRRTVSK